MGTIQLVLTMAIKFGYKLHQMDVKSAFLNVDLEEKVYIYQLQGFPKPNVLGKEHLICKLKKARYGLKQAPRAWCIEIDKYLGEQGFQICPFDPNLYVKSKNGDVVILVIYVDNIIIVSS
jgi:hypothetical protein